MLSMILRHQKKKEDAKSLHALPLWQAGLLAGRPSSSGMSEAGCRLKF